MAILLLCFAVVIVGCMANLKGTFFAAFALGMVIVLVFRPIDV